MLPGGALRPSRPRLSRPALHRLIVSLLPPENRIRLETVLRELAETIGGFARGELVAATTMVVVAFLGLNVIGVQYPLVLALLAGLGELIPIAGPFIAAVPAITVALLDSPHQALVVLAFYLVVQQVESNLLVPHVMRAQANIPPVLAVFALIAGHALGGILGAIIAIPFAGVVRVLVVRSSHRHCGNGLEDQRSWMTRDPRTHPDGLF